MNTERVVKVYKSGRKVDTYLYVDFKTDLAAVPDALLQQFGEPKLALSLNLTATRKLAQADPQEVLRQIESRGYYLQLPPPDGGVDGTIARGSG
jgi:uncharacterized protein YcgL (UPF0745 family)